MYRPGTPSGSDVVRGRCLTALVAVLALCSSPADGLAAQGVDLQALPLIEPRLTRVIGSDTLQIQEPALSPDGRWVLFSTRTPAGGGYVYIVSADGGETRRLIDNPDALEPSWFPAGDRIAYYSRENQAIMTAPFDGQRGQISGPAQRVTLDVALPWYRLSPDGRRIAYRSFAGEGMILRVIPSNGGTARTLDVPAGLVFLLDWSADGQYVYYGARPSNSQQGGAFRVAVDGGDPEPAGQFQAGPTAPQVPYIVSPVPNVEPPFLVARYSGIPVARIALPHNATPAQFGRTFTPDGRKLLAVVSNTANPMRVLPVAGGAPRQLGEARASEIPLGWSPDGNDVLFATQLNGREAIMSAPVTGGAAREVGPMPDRGPPTRDQWAYPITFSADGKYLSYSRPTGGSEGRTLAVRPVAGGDERVVTGALDYHEGFRLTGPGGTPNIAGTDFLYLERQGKRVELKATSPQGSSRLIRSFADSNVGRGWPIGVFENRVAFLEGGFSFATGPGPARIVVARGAQGEPKMVADVPGVIAFDDIVWSADGRWIAATAHLGSADEASIKVLVVGVTPDGDASTPPRLIDTPMTGSAWGLRWLPDGSAVTLYGQTPPDMGFDVYLVPVRNNGRPVALTRDDPGEIEFNLLSPDGRYVAYRARVERGTSLWLADLGDWVTTLQSGTSN